MAQRTEFVQREARRVGQLGRGHVDPPDTGGRTATSSCWPTGASIEMSSPFTQTRQVTEHLGEAGAVARFGGREHLANGVAVDDIGPRSGGLAGRGEQTQCGHGHQSTSAPSPDRVRAAGPRRVRLDHAGRPPGAPRRRSRPARPRAWSRGRGDGRRLLESASGAVEAQRRFGEDPQCGEADQTRPATRPAWPPPVRRAASARGHGSSGR